jgi:hypothetical protein
MEHLPIIYLYFKGFVIFSSFSFDFKKGTIYDVPLTPSFKEILFSIIFKLFVFLIWLSDCLVFWLSLNYFKASILYFSFCYNFL